MKNPFKNFKTKRQLRKENTELKKLTNLESVPKIGREDLKINTIRGVYRIVVERDRNYPPEHIVLYDAIKAMLPEIIGCVQIKERNRTTEGFSHVEYIKFQLQILAEESPDAKEE